MPLHQAPPGRSAPATHRAGVWRAHGGAVAPAAAAAARTVLLVTAFLGVALPGLAKAYYAGKKEMIQKAECIAIVNITGVEQVEKQGKPWIYRQKASATIVRCLKGDATGAIVLYGMETFICAQCQFERGRFILFLRKDGELWVGSNWHLGIRPITGEQVKWYKGEENLFEMADAPLADVLKEISAIVAEQANAAGKTQSGDAK